jgi:hypothetical protein
VHVHLRAHPSLEGVNERSDDFVLHDKGFKLRDEIRLSAFVGRPEDADSVFNQT